jgi:2-polyprenyl-6-methoxyphenol hydroxylase-like FAD-dependent oxidoreductase
MDYDVVVAGAGPVGLTLSGLLARQGLRCLAVDRNAERTDKSKALVLWPRTLELLASVGAEQPFLAAGSPAHRGRVFSHGRPLGHLDFSRSGSVFASVLMIPQSETERHLEAAALAAGVELRRSTELLRFSPDHEGVRVALRGADGVEREHTCAWLVGCDGAHSSVRHGLGLNFAGAAETADWILADLHIDGGLPRDEVSIHFHPDGVLALFPIPPDRFRIIADLDSSGEAHSPDPTLAEAQAVIDRRGPGGLTVRDPVWMSCFRINDRQVPTYRVGRVFLAGDAAHIHSPAGGQGMNTGMQDAFNLAWKLALVQQGRAKPLLLDTYQSERHPVGAMIVRGAANLTRVGTVRAAWAQRLRDFVLQTVYQFPAAHTAIVRVLTEIGIHYRRSPLVRDERSGRKSGVRAGDRVPDLPLREGRLHTRLRGGRHALLLPNADPAIGAAVAAAFGDLCDVIDVGPAFGEEIAAVARPDGYLGYIGPARVENVVGYLDSYLVRAA